MSSVFLLEVLRPKICAHRSGWRQIGSYVGLRGGAVRKGLSGKREVSLRVSASSQADTTVLMNPAQFCAG